MPICTHASTYTLVTYHQSVKRRWHWCLSNHTPWQRGPISQGACSRRCSLRRVINIFKQSACLLRIMPTDRHS